MPRTRDRSQILLPARRVAVDVLHKQDVEATRGNTAIVKVELYNGAPELFVSLSSEHFTDTFTGGVYRFEACGFQTANLDCVEQLGWALVAAGEKARDANMAAVLAANIEAATKRAKRTARATAKKGGR